MAPSISLRSSIRWLPDPATEPTTTIVLTSARNIFVDIRILEPTPSDSNSNNAHDAVGADLLSFSRLDWAFAGTSSSSFAKDPETGVSTVHSKWAHWVSNRAGDVSEVVDEGQMYAQADGSTLEVGKMVNPATGVETEYEEVWLDPAPIATMDAAGTGAEGRRIVAVLRLHDDAKGARGVVVRVGQYCQGVLRVGEYFALERWVWMAGKGWRRSARIGDLWLPCGVLLEVEDGSVTVVEGGEVRYGDYVWRCEELGEF